MNTIVETEDKIRTAMAEINRAVKNGSKGTPMQPEVQPFVALSQKLADSMVQVYEAQLNEIANKLEDAKATAQQIRDMTEAKAKDISDYKYRIERFGNTMIEAHSLFIKENS